MTMQQSMDSVTFERKRSANYQSMGASVTLQVLEDWRVDETMKLARAMVDAQVGMRVQNRKEVNTLLRAYYGDDDLDIEDFGGDFDV